jgi:hypothetical protein
MSSSRQESDHHHHMSHDLLLVHSHIFRPRQNMSNLDTDGSPIIEIEDETAAAATGEGGAHAGMPPPAVGEHHQQQPGLPPYSYPYPYMPSAVSGGPYPLSSFSQVADQPQAAKLPLPRPQEGSRSETRLLLPKNPNALGTAKSSEGILSIGAYNVAKGGAQPCVSVQPYAAAAPSDSQSEMNEEGNFSAESDLSLAKAGI